jgi:hypothetical protein
MSETIQTDIVSFDGIGNAGVRLAVTTSTASVAIPNTQARQNYRVVICNYGTNPAFVRVGSENVSADTNCYCMLPGTKEVFSIAYTVPNQLYIAAVTESGATTIQVSAGRGS